MSKLRREISKLLSKIQIDFGGGCSVSKAYVMAYLIRRLKMKTTLDIGVYRGRSLFPQALSHSLYTNGIVYGVDPWSNEEAKENDNFQLKEEIDKFLQLTDLSAIFEDVNNFRQIHGFEKNSHLIRETSENAAQYFIDNNIKFNLIHIDGNHDTAKVMQDVELYFSLLQPEGFIVLDDVSWDSVKPAYQKIDAQTYKVFERIDKLNDYAVFWNTDSKLNAAWVRKILWFIGKG